MEYFTTIMRIFMKFRKPLLLLVLLVYGTLGKGQIYKYIGLEDGLNNQKIYHIQKDRRGYMWFLTQEGVDRYDGKHIKHYTFSDDSMKLDSRIALNWLYMDQEDVLWVIGQKGRIFRYDSQHDKFELAYVHPELIRNKSQAFLNYGYLDKNDHIWLNSKSSPNNIYKILPKFTNINVSLGKFVYRHNYSSEVYSYFLNLRYFRS